VRELAPTTIVRTELNPKITDHRSLTISSLFIFFLAMSHFLSGDETMSDVLSSLP
jgi:hypothetical protein